MAVKIITTISEMQSLSDLLRRDGMTIGFVPTMGYLHEGHVSLIRKSKEFCSKTIVSIFVNPTQFSPNEDLEKYPRNFERDFEMLENASVDYLFFPNTTEIYSSDSETFVNLDVLSKKLEGEFRPTHFRGVATIVTILLNCVKPHYSFFGQKDAQQAAVIKKMVKDLKFDCSIVICPIIRENDGLAMSSRNVYLNSQERQDAALIYQSLLKADQLIKDGERNSNTIISESLNIINKVENFSLDYLKIVDSETFQELEHLNTLSCYILIACKVGNTRLIDNLLINL